MTNYFETVNPETEIPNDFLDPTVFGMGLGMVLKGYIMGKTKTWKLGSVKIADNPV